MEEMLALRDSPQRRRPEFVCGGGSLLEAVGEARSHVVEQQIRV